MNISCIFLPTRPNKIVALALKCSVLSCNLMLFLSACTYHTSSISFVFFGMVSLLAWMNITRMEI